MLTEFEQCVAHCVDSANQGRICPVIGAGASAGAGLPSWEGLIRALDAEGAECAAAFPPGEQATVRGDLTWAVECLRMDRGESEFRNQVRRAVYGEQDPGWVSVGNGFRYQALYYLARLCVRIAYERQGDDSSFAFDALSYNFDCLLEEAIEALAPQCTVQAIVPAVGCGHDTACYSWGHSGDRRQTGLGPTVRIFHPHGALPRSPDRKAYPVPGRAAAALTAVNLPLMFGAEEYDRRGGTTKMVHNVIQLAAFAQRVCLFYGWSFQDPLVRQLLRIAAELASARGSRQHVAVLRRQQREIPSYTQLAHRLKGLGVPYQVWTDDPLYEDQISFLYRVWTRLDPDTASPMPSLDC